MKLTSSILAMVVAAGFATSAHAADVNSMKDTPIQVSPCVGCFEQIDWTGFSIGLQAGVTNSNHDISSSDEYTKWHWFHTHDYLDLLNTDGLNASGFSGRVFIQYDYQIGDVVVGARGWYGLTDASFEISGSQFKDDKPNGSFKKELEEQENYGGVIRLGRLFGPGNRALIYGVAGWQFGSYDIKLSEDGEALVDNGGYKDSVDHDGPVAGVGFEYALTSMTFVSLEYQHWWAGTEGLTTADAAENGFSSENTLNVDTVHAGLRFKF